MVFLPTDISGLAAWYDAGDAASITGTTPVTQWNDKSGNARHLTHATLGPDYVAASGVMRFNGPSSASAAGDYLNLPSMTVRTVFALFKAFNPQTATNRYHALLGHGANTDTLYLDLPAGTPSSYGIRPKNGLNKTTLNGGSWVNQTTADATVPVSFTLSGDIVGVEYTSARTGLTYMGGAGTAGGGPDWRPNWDLAEVVIFDRALTTDEKQEMEGYLAHKWGRADLLPSGHPYKASAPGSAVTLAADFASHAHSASSPALSVAGTLSVAGATHGQSASSPAFDNISLNDVAEHRIIQRLGTSGAIALSGGYTRTDPTEIQARVTQGVAVVKDWTTLTGAAIGGGNWSGTLDAVPQGGMYTIQVRSRDDSGAVLASVPGSHSWGVGDIYGLIGSSSAERWFTIGTGYSPDPLLKVYDGTWKAATATGAAAVTFGNRAIADCSVPVAIMDYGVGGTKLNQWVTTSDASYAAFRSALAAVGPIKAAIAVVGMNDARADEIASQSSHEANWRTLISHIRADAGDAGLPVLIWGAQRCAQAGMDDQQFAWMRNGEYAVGQDAGVTLALTTVDLELIGDNLHLTETGMVTAAARLARTAGALFHGTGLEWRPPEAMTATLLDDTHSDVTIVHHAGGDFTPASGITGFQISTDDFATMLGIDAAVRQSANVIRLTHATTGGTIAKLRYQYGASPDVSGAVNDNSLSPLPLTPMRAALSIFAGAYLVPGTGMHAISDSEPMLIDHVSVSLIPANADHALGGQALSLSAWPPPNRRRTLRVPGETRVTAITAD